MSKTLRFLGKQLIGKRKAPIEDDVEDEPRSGSVNPMRLTDYAFIEKCDHASSSVLFNTGESKFHARGGFLSAIKLYHKLQDKVPAVTTVIDEAGWSLFFQLPETPSTPKLVEAVAERFWRTTHSFHFPFGEMGFTPSDWAMITGIDIGLGSSIPYDPAKYTKAYVIENVFPELGTMGDEKKHWISGAFTLTFLKSYCDDSYLNKIGTNQTLIDRVARAFFMYFLGQVLFPNAKTYIDAGWLAAFENIEKVKDYDWGGAAFAYLYLSLDQLSQKTTSMNGPWQVLEYWFYEYFGNERPSSSTELPAIGRPRASRWTMDERKRCFPSYDLQKIKDVRDIIGRQETNFLIRNNPWIDIVALMKKDRGLTMAEDLSCRRVIFRYLDIGVWYLGDRCYSQLEGSFGIPADPPKHLSDISIEQYERCKSNGWQHMEGYVRVIGKDDHAYRSWWNYVTSSQTEAATIHPPDKLPYGQLYHVYKEQANVINQLRNLHLEQTRYLVDEIKKRDKILEINGLEPLSFVCPDIIEI